MPLFTPLQLAVLKNIVAQQQDNSVIGNAPPSSVTMNPNDMASYAAHADDAPPPQAPTPTNSAGWADYANQLNQGGTAPAPQSNPATPGPPTASQWGPPSNDLHDTPTGPPVGVPNDQTQATPATPQEPAGKPTSLFGTSSGASPLGALSKEHQNVFGNVESTYDNAQGTGDVNLEGRLGDIKQSEAARTGLAYQNYNSLVDDLDQKSKSSWDQATKSYELRNYELQNQMDNLPKVDPSHWWNTKSTGQKLLAALGVALGAFGAAMPHTTNHVNYAYDIMRSAITDDIQSQKDNLTTEWNKITQGQSVNKNDLARAMWEKEQVSKQKEFSLNKLNAWVGQIKSDSDSQSAIVNAGMLQNKIQRELQSVKLSAIDDRYKLAMQQSSAANAGGLSAVKAYQELVSKAFEQHQQAIMEGKISSNTPVSVPSFSEFAAARMGGGAQFGNSTASNGLNYKSLQEIPQVDRAKAVNINGSWIIAPSEEAAKTAREQTETTSRMQSALDVIKRVRDESTSTGFITPNNLAAYNAAAADVINSYPGLIVGKEAQARQGEIEMLRQSLVPPAPGMIKNWIQQHVIGGGLNSTITNLEAKIQSATQARDASLGIAPPQSQLPPGVTPRS